MEFRSIGFTWTGPTMPDSVAVTNIRTGAPIQILSDAFNQFFDIVDDGLTINRQKDAAKGMRKTGHTKEKKRVTWDAGVRDSVPSSKAFLQSPQ